MKDVPHLVADSIGKRLGRRDVLTAASVCAYPGRITALLGRNGAGKSTLMKICAGWLRPDYGSVRFADRRHLRPRLAELATLGLFYLPDRTLLCSYRTVAEHLAAVRRVFTAAATDEATEMYRLAEFLGRKPAALSSGERRRTEAALAWARRPTCLLADEPFRGLSPQDQLLLSRGLREMAGRGTAIIVTGHEVEILLDIADHVVWATAGTTHELGPPEAARTNFQFMRDYLGNHSSRVSDRRMPDDGADATPTADLTVDEQTLRDLEIFTASTTGPSVFELLDHTRTNGGRNALRRRFAHPPSDGETIRKTQQTIRFLLDHEVRFLVDADVIDDVTRYLNAGWEVEPGHHMGLASLQALWTSLRYPDFLQFARRGVEACQRLMTQTRQVLEPRQRFDQPTHLTHLIEGLWNSVDRVERGLGQESRRATVLLRQDRWLRGECPATLRRMLHTLAELDALCAMADATRRHELVFPEIVDSSGFALHAEGVYSLFLDHPVRNPVTLDARDRLIFLTGPNMAGKTTYLRSVAVAAFLAHLGMGVPCDRLRLAPLDALVTSLSPENALRSGLSYYLAEVRRVRQIAEALAAKKRALVLVDEPFKGTNVKDAYEASRLVIRGFADCPHAASIVASHLVELAAELDDHPAIRFACFRGRIDAGKAIYTYHLQPGVSQQRFGLHLLEADGVPGLLRFPRDPAKRPHNTDGS